MNEYLEELKEVLENCHDYGTYLVSLCPNHEDSRPSFFVYPDKYRCASCGFWGRTSELLGKLDKTKARYKHDVPSYHNPFSTWLKTTSLSGVLRNAWEDGNRCPRLVRYISEKRGISEPFRYRLGIGYKDDWFTFPIRNRSGKIVGAVARASPENPAQAKYIVPHGTSPWLLYVPNWHYENQNRIVLCYGIIDAITLAINGVMAMSSLTGKSINPMAFSEFRKRIIIVPDLGEEKEANILASKLGWRGDVYLPTYGEGCKDINDMWMKNPELVKEMCRELV